MRNVLIRRYHVFPSSYSPGFPGLRSGPWGPQNMQTDSTNKQAGIREKVLERRPRAGVRKAQSREAS